MYQLRYTWYTQCQPAQFENYISPEKIHSAVVKRLPHFSACTTTVYLYRCSSRLNTHNVELYYLYYLVQGPTNSITCSESVRGGASMVMHLSSWQCSCGTPSAYNDSTLAQGVCACRHTCLEIGDGLAPARLFDDVGPDFVSKRQSLLSDDVHGSVQEALYCLWGFMGLIQVPE